MKIPDANVLINAVNEGSTNHAAARRWLDGALNEDEGVGLAWLVILAFLRVSTHPAILDSPLTRFEALESVEAWLAQRPATVVEPTQRHVSILRSLLDTAGHGGNLVNDAHLAALALEHGAQLVTFDRDFGRWDVPYLIPS